MRKTMMPLWASALIVVALYAGIAAAQVGNGVLLPVDQRKQAPVRVGEQVNRHAVTSKHPLHFRAKRIEIGDMLEDV